jgi:hypothetical protein
MAGLDPAAIDRIVSALDLELAKRRTRRDAAEDERWAIEHNGDEVILFALRLAREWDRRVPGAAPPRDRDAVERLETEIVELVYLASHIELLERRKEDEANGVVERRVKPAIRVKSKDPGAPRKERASPPAPAEIGPIVRTGTVVNFHPRDWTGVIRATTGELYPLAVGALRNSGLTTLTRGQMLEFKVYAGEADELTLRGWARPVNR